MMQIQNDNGSTKAQVWEILIIVLIWMQAVWLIYIVFCNAVTGKLKSN